MTETLNGLSVWFRFITPLMLGLLMAMVHQDFKGREDLRADVSSVKTSLENHVLHLNESQTQIRERISRMEGQLDNLTRRFKVAL